MRICVASWILATAAYASACGNNTKADAPAASGGSLGAGGNAPSGGTNALAGAGSSMSGGQRSSGGETSVFTGGRNGAGGQAVALGGKDSGTGKLTLPPANASFDYQIGGPYAPPQGVKVISRDREAEPAPGIYNICYVNGFQTQPQDNDSWLKDHPELIVHDKNGQPVEDENWGEYLFDTSTAEKRAALLEIVGPWIVGCADTGFDAVEVDNLDSYSRSGGQLKEEHNVAFIQRLSEIAHASKLAIGQKNSAELLPRREAMGTDFAVAEECNHWKECGDYQDAYGNLVFVIEYERADFEAGCKDYPELSIVLRDVNVSAPGGGSYVYEGC